MEEPFEVADVEVMKFGGMGTLVYLLLREEGLKDMMIFDK